MRRWISQNNIRLPRGAFFISALFFFNAVCIVSDNLLIIESFGEMAYNISYLTRVPGTNTLLAAIFIGGEIFGYDYLPYFFIVCTAAYVFNRNSSIYSRQKLTKYSC